MTPPASPTHGTRKWTIFIDGASSSTGRGAGIILKNGEGILVEVSLALTFPTSNNQTEYEAFLIGLWLAKDLGAEEIEICTNSQLVPTGMRIVPGQNNHLAKYLALVKENIFQVHRRGSETRS